MQWPVRAYSTGMRAKFAFALSMAIDFECMLIDEVLGVGDAAFRARCHAAIEERRARSDIILISHNLKDVIRLCDQVVILGGREPIVSDNVQKTVKQYAASMGNMQEALEL
jgi:capsular polysaccharide transport system ATP-binding protein